MSCGPDQVHSNTELTESFTINADAELTFRVGTKRYARSSEAESWGEPVWAELQETRIDTHDNDVLLVWVETTIRFPGIWPAESPLVVHRKNKGFPLRIEFPEPTTQQAGGDGRPAVSEAVWYSDRLEVDGVVSKLIEGRHYVFTGDGLQESPE